MLRKIKRRIALGTLLAGILVVGVAVYGNPDLRWRAGVVGLKAMGKLDGVDWKELLHMVRPGSGYWLEPLLEEPNPYSIIRNPHASADDVAKGESLFALRCAKCHGEHATGGVGPALVGRGFTHGDSDWAVFQTMTHGVPGTAMLPVGLSDLETWQVISHLRALAGQAHVGALTAEGSAAGAGNPAAGSGASANGDAPKFSPVTYQRLLTAGSNTEEWLLPYGTYNGFRHAADTQIDASNVSRLSIRWIHQFGTHNQRIETVPVISGGMMFVTLPRGTLIALDAASGRQIWEYHRTPPPDLALCCSDANRGVAVYGNKVYMETLDAHVLAFDAATGKLLWDRSPVNYRDGYSMTSAPLALDGMLVTGIAGGDFSTIGFIVALDAETGAEKWRIHTIPGPGEPGRETWGGDSAKTGGATTWLPGTYDPELGLLYWGTGNPAPDYNATTRPGDNLYSNSVLAIQASTGKLVWHFQYTPGDDHDWDSVQPPMLVDAQDGGAPRKLLIVANRNGFFYVLDRQTGAFIRGAPYARQTWADGLTPAGRPLRRANTSPSPQGTYLLPSVSGATNWWQSSFSPETHLYYVPALERSGVFFSTKVPPSPEPGQPFYGSGGQGVGNQPHYTVVRAIDPATAQMKWEFRRPVRSEEANIGGLLSTAGDLVFGSDLSDIFALRATDGALLWMFNAGSKIDAAPVSYRSGGKQMLAIAAGQILIAFALPDDEPRASAQTHASPGKTPVTSSAANQGT